MTDTIEIQNKIKELFNNNLNGSAVIAKNEWDTARNSKDNFNRALHYAPRLDIAVGPLMTKYITNEEKEKLSMAFNNNENLINLIIKSGIQFKDFSFNRNPRCLIAIEIETSGTRKHLIGDIINASIMGKVGIIVPTNEKNYRAFERIIKYLEFAQQNEKMNNNVFRNIVLIKSKDLISLLEEYNETNC